MKKIEKLSAAAFPTAVREGGFFYNNTAMAKKQHGENRAAPLTCRSER